MNPPEVVYGMATASSMEAEAPTPARSVGVTSGS